MKNTFFIYQYFWVVVLFGFISLSGCSVVGLIIGTNAENKSKKPIQISVWDIQLINKNTDLTFVLKNGEQITGKFKQLQLLDDAEYEPIYNKCFSEFEGKIVLPEIGDTVDLTISDFLNSKKKTFVRQCFSGFDKNYILLKSEDQINKYYPYNNIDRATFGNRVMLDINKVQYFIKAGSIPVKLFVITDKNEKINPVEVQYVQYQNKSKNETLWGLGVGLAIDLFLRAIVVPNIDFF